MKSNINKIKNDTPVTSGILDDAVDTILQGMDNMLKDVVKKSDLDETNKRLGNVESRLEKVEDGLEEVKNDIHWMRDDINGIKADLSDTPSRREFNELKEKVDDYLQ